MEKRVCDLHLKQRISKTSCTLPDDVCLHEVLEDLRDAYRTVSLLVILHYTYHHPGQGKAGAVQSMNKARFGIRSGTVSDIRPARLEIGTVGA